MATPIFTRNLQLFVEANELAGADGTEVTSFTDLSGSGRHLVATASKPLVKANAVNSKKSVIWNGSKNPLVFTGAFTIRCGFLVVKVNGNFNGSYEGILSSPANFGILVGIGGTNLFYDFQYDYYEYRLNDRIHPKTNAPAPISSFGIIYFKFWQNLDVEGIQLGQDRAFTDRKFDGEVALMALYNREFCERDVRKMFQSIGNSYQLALPDVFPYQGSKSDPRTLSKRVLSDGQDEPVLRVKRTKRTLFDLSFNNRTQSELDAARAFWNDFYPTKRFIYRDYEELPPVDTIVRFPEESQPQWRGGLTVGSRSYGFQVFESIVAPATAIPSAPVVPDETPPVISLDNPEPAPGGYSGDLILNGSASDNDAVSSIRFYVDGLPYGSPVSESSFKASGFTIDTTAFSNSSHAIHAVATDPSGNQTSSNTLTLTFNNAPPDTEAPTVPGTPGLTVVSDTQINGSFTGSTDNVGVTHYRLQRATNSGFTTGVVDTDLGTSTSFSATGLSPSTTYYFKVLAEDAAANQSAYSSSANATTNNESLYPETISSIIHWFRAKSITDGTNGQPYGTWEDLIGSADASSSGTARPTYYANSGDPYLEFDGTDDYLAMTLGAGLNDFTVIIIAEFITKPDYKALICAPFFGRFNFFTVSGNLYWQDGAPFITGSLPSAPTGFVAVFAKRTASLATFRVNGSETTDAGFGNITTSTSIAFGADPTPDAFGNVRIKEIIICSDDISSGEFAGLTTYINNQHGLTL